MTNFEVDQSILPFPEYNSKRRTVVLNRVSFEEPFGIALQSYVFKRGINMIERVTYVDYVKVGGPACKAGILRGDVIVAVNGLSVIGDSHSSLVKLMSSHLQMRVVVIFQNIARIIELTARSLRLQFLLREKQMILESVEAERKKILDKYGLEDEDDTESGFGSCAITYSETDSSTEASDPTLTHNRSDNGFHSESTVSTDDFDGCQHNAGLFPLVTRL